MSELLFWLVPLSPFSLSNQAYTPIHAQDQGHFEGIMNQLGVSVAERGYVEQLALRPNQTSKGSTNMSIPLTSFAPRKLPCTRNSKCGQRSTPNRHSNNNYRRPNLSLHPKLKLARLLRFKKAQSSRSSAGYRNIRNVFDYTDNTVPTNRRT